MSGDTPALVYLEADDEITAVVRRVRGADAARVVVVAPGRSRATSSGVALRLLARAGAEAGREVVVVGDALTRSLAAEAGLAAFGSVDEGRSATLDGPVAPALDEPRHAAIHVVRGAATDDTVAAPVAAAVTLPVPGSMDETRAVPVQRRPGPVASPRIGAPRRPSVGLAVVLGTATALLAAGIVAGATLLPAATVTIVPRPAPVSETYKLVVEAPFRREGTVEATATVTASGTYEVLETAQGTVVFFNWTFVPVEIPAGTFVAAGEQAFATQTDITVERGRLTAEGTIAAGEQSVAVVAAAAGPAANVAAGVIDTILDEDVDARLRGFPENTRPRVTNPEPTAGGVDETGPEITEADVDAAQDELAAELRRRAADARPDVGDLHVVEDSVGEPQIEVPEGLVGTRDQAEAEIAGSLSWSLVAIDLGALDDEAAARLASDPALPEGHDLLPDTVTVDLGEPVLDGETVTVEATVEAMTAPRIDEATIVERVIGRTEAEAELALADIGDADIALWPGWVEAVPGLDWRVDVRIEALAP